MSLFMVWLNRIPEHPVYPRCSACEHVADPHGPEPGHTAPLSTDDYAAATEPRRCRPRWPVVVNVLAGDQNYKSPPLQIKRICE